MIRRRSTLTRIVALRITVFALLAMAVQAAVVFTDYYFDDEKLATLMIESETAALAAGFIVDGDRLTYALPSRLDRYGLADTAYLARVRTPEGRTIFSNCDARCDALLLPHDVSPPGLWSRVLSSGKPLKIAGGRTVVVGSRRVFVEIAILDDHRGIMWHVLRSEYADDLAVPMSIMLVFVLFGTLLAVHLALKPLGQAAREAEHIDPLDPDHIIGLSNIPREIANLVAAVNRSLQRIGALMRSQRLFTTAVAHEIRTPLAMMKLELGMIAHPGARKIEGDIDDLATFIGQMTALGRLEGAERRNFGLVALDDVARHVVTDMAPWVYDQGHTIAFVDAGGGLAQGLAGLIEDAVRNLVDNAVKHTPAGTAIEVISGPGRCLAVIDNAGRLGEPQGFGGTRMAADHLGLGLEIVRRIMALHRGSVQTAVVEGVRTEMRLRFG